MSESNGHTNGRIITRPLGKQHDLITRAQAQELVTAECAKVHSFYLEQIPPFVANMIHDALLSYGLIKPIEQQDDSIPPASEEQSS